MNLKLNIYRRVSNRPTSTYFCACFGWLCTPTSLPARAALTSAQRTEN